MVVEVTRKAYLASLVPVIVDAILNEHQVIADIVAFVPRGDFPRSRLGEKQRGKILASWVTRKLRTIAQFSIRDADGTANHFPDLPQHRTSRASKPGSTMGNSTRRNTLVYDNEPRSPAVLENVDEAPANPYHGDVKEQRTPSEFNQVATAPYVDAPAPRIAEIPRRQDSLHNSQLSNRIMDHPPSLPDLNFHYGEASNTATGPAQPMGTPLYMAETAPQMSQGRDSVPSSASWRGEQSSLTHTTTTRSSGQGDAMGEWPQEALLYHSQSNLEVDNNSFYNPADVHRTPSSSSEVARRRYDGSGYGYGY